MLRSPENLNHFLVGNTLPNLARMFWRERREIDRWRKAAAQMITSAVLSPFRLVERVRVDELVRETRIEHPPVFVLGHFRSGTTHLHTLLAQDPSLGYVPTILSLLPNMGLSGGRIGARLFARLAPERRPMDEMPVDPWLPQEDEIGVGNMLPFSGFSAFFFPSKALECFRRYVLFDDASPREVQEWRGAEDTMIRKATVMFGGRRIVLKNPWNTARIPHLLELYPDARFVHIRRNPWEVYVSSMHLLNTLGRLLAFSDFTDEEAEEYLLSSYRQTMERYFETEHFVPAGNLVEVSFEELLAEPHKVLDRIYTGLRLPSFDDAVPHVNAYLEGVREHRRNRFVYTADVIDRVAEEWRFTIDRWGYLPPAAG